MNKAEFVKVFAVIKAAYPNSTIMNNKETVEVWFELLGDLEYGLCMKAVREHIMNSEFAPTIAAIRKGCTREIEAFADSWDEAWDKIMAAVRKYGTYGAAEAMESLDDLTRKSVRAIGFCEICTSSNTNFLRKEFKGIYEQNKQEYDRKAQANSGALAIEGR